MRIAIVCSGGEERLDGGGVFLGQVIAGLPGVEVRLFRFDIGGTPPTSGGVLCPTTSIPVRGPIRGLGALRRTSRSLADRVEWTALRPLEWRSVAEGLRGGLEDFAPDTCLVVMNSIEPIVAAASAFGGLGIPFTTMEWDPPSTVARIPGVPVSVTQRTLRAHEWLVTNATANGVASEGMAKTYWRRFGREGIVLRQYVRDRPVPPGAKERSPEGWRIYFAGNAYARAEFEAFLGALDLAGWSMAGRPVTLRYLGRSWPFGDAPGRRIERFGWQPLERALELAAGCDLGYVGYWFDPARTEEVMNCFPSKMISYVGAGLPAFFHGPELSGPAAFVRAYGVGQVCTRQDPPGIRNDLELALSLPAQVRAWRQRCADLAATEFSRATFTDRLRRLLGVLPSPPAPPSDLIASGSPSGCCPRRSRRSSPASRGRLPGSAK